MKTKEWTIDQIRDFVKKGHQSVSARMVDCMLSHYDQECAELRRQVEELKERGQSCDYIGHDFGANYIDSCCIDGQLYDMDDCDDEGNLYEPIEHKPCPKCNHDNWLDRFEDELVSRGYGDFESGIHEYLHEPVRFEQEGDEDRLRKWWQEGYELAYKESKEEYDKINKDYYDSMGSPNKAEQLQSKPDLITDQQIIDFIEEKIGTNAALGYRPIDTSILPEMFKEFVQRSKPDIIVPGEDEIDDRSIADPFDSEHASFFWPKGFKTGAKWAINRIKELNK